jgi:hypothetical protein
VGGSLVPGLVEGRRVHLTLAVCGAVCLLYYQPRHLAHFTEVSTSKDNDLTQVIVNTTLRVILFKGNLHYWSVHLICDAVRVQTNYIRILVGLVMYYSPFVITYISQEIFANQIYFLQMIPAPVEKFSSHAP